MGRSSHRCADKSWIPALSPAEIRSAVQDNLGLDATDIVNLRMMDMGPEEGPLEKELAIFGH